MKRKLRDILHLPARNQTRRFTRSKIGNFFYFLFIGGGAFFSVIPMIYCFVTSFKPLDELLVFPPTLFTVKRPTIANFLALPDLISSLSVPLSRYVFNSLFISIVGTIISILSAAMAGFVLSKAELPFRKTIFTLIQFSLLFNAYTLSIPRYIIYSTMGVINTYWIYLLPTLASSMGAFLMKQYMDGYVPKALIEAAHIDGADWFQIFGRVVIPIIKPVILTQTLFSFLSLWNVGNAGTIFSEQLKTLPTVMASIASGGLARTGSAMATSVIMMIPPILVYLISQSSIKETMGSAGIKG